MAIDNYAAIPQESIEETESLYYVSKDGIIPFLDHPNMVAHKKLPKHYRAYYSLKAVISDYQRGIINENHILILKALGDAICCSEDHLRRCFAGKLSRSQVSKLLDQLATNDYVQRYKVSVRGEEESYPNFSRVFVLGIAGKLLMDHFYSGMSNFVHPERFHGPGASGLMQRYIALNELRTMFIERRVASKWQWSGSLIGGNSTSKVSAAVELNLPQGRLNIYMERAQMKQNFIGYLKDKLGKWEFVYKKQNGLKIRNFPVNPTTVVLYVSTLSMAQAIHKEIVIDSFPFPVWFLVEEEVEMKGLEYSFYRADKEKLKRLHVGFLATTQEN
ncbi:hypothetical protein [Oceanobacillus luteolus]|uniref:Replication-relaxation n=1 Tax=Oceanobacillus luteolus TaxID=1274358 RepID=A0ABW4HYB5_9BACI